MRRILLLLSLLAVPATAHAQYGGTPGYPSASRPADYVAGPFLRVPEHDSFYSPRLWMMAYPPDLGPVPVGILVQVDPARPFHPLYVPQFGRGWSYMPPGMERGSRGPGGGFIGVPYRVGEGMPTYSGVTTSRAGRPRSGAGP